MPSFTVHQVNVWADPNPGPAALVPMPNSLLWTPAGRELGQPGRAILFAPRWGGYPYDATAQALGPTLADRGYGFLSLGLRRRGAEGQLLSTPDDDLRDIKLGVDYLAAIGFDEILLLGEEVGALSVARYQAKTRDLRIKGVALLRPAADLAAWLRDALGDEHYNQQARHSLVATRQGAGLDDLVDMTVQGFDGAPMLIHQHSAIWLTWWGALADTRLSRIIEDVLSPVLIVPGDDRAWGDSLRQLKAIGAAYLAEAATHDAQATAIAAWADTLTGSSVVTAPLEIVNAKTADGTSLTGLLWEPVAQVTDTAILCVPGLTGGPQSQLYARLGPLFAKTGIAALAIEMRRSGRGGHLSATLDMDVEDIGAFVGLLVERGYRRIILAGISLGSISIMVSHARRHYPNVVALVHLAPTADCPDWARRGMGNETYNATTKRAQIAVAAGRGDEALIDVSYRRADPDPFHILMRYPQRAASWLTWWGPDADTVNSHHIAEVDVPILLMSGTEDNYNDPARMNALQAAATRSPAVEQRWYEDCDHGFAGFERRVVDDVTQWLGSIGIR